VGDDRRRPSLRSEQLPEEGRVSRRGDGTCRNCGGPLFITASSVYCRCRETRDTTAPPRIAPPPGLAYTPGDVYAYTVLPGGITIYEAKRHPWPVRVA
jgi:hypothetical protein